MTLNVPGEISRRQILEVIAALNLPVQLESLASVSIGSSHVDVVGYHGGSQFRWHIPITWTERA